MTSEEIGITLPIDPQEYDEKYIKPFIINTYNDEVEKIIGNQHLDDLLAKEKKRQHTKVKFNKPQFNKDEEVISVGDLVVNNGVLGKVVDTDESAGILCVLVNGDIQVWEYSTTKKSGGTKWK